MVQKAALWKMRAKEPFWKFLPWRKFIIHKVNLDTGNGPRFGGIGLCITSPNAIRAFKTSRIMFIHV